MANKEQKQTLVNGKPVEDEDEATNTPGDQGNSQTDGGKPVEKPDNEAGTTEPGSVGFEPPGSIRDIKQGVVDRFERIKKEGPEPIRQAAKGLIDNIFDAVDAGFARWFGEKK